MNGGRPGIEEIRAARERLAGVARVTPLYPSETLARLGDRPVLLKAENLQRTGAFKIRGAFNTIAQRILKAPVRWRFSAFRRTGRSPRRARVSDG